MCIEKLKEIWRDLNREYPCSLLPECKKVWDAEASRTDEYPCSLEIECRRETTR